MISNNHIKTVMNVTYVCLVKKAKLEKKLKNETPFLPKVEVNRVVKKKNRHRSRAKKELKPIQKKEFEPFNTTSAYGRFMANPVSKQRFASMKFRSTITSDTPTDYTCPTLPD